MRIILKSITLSEEDFNTFISYGEVTISKKLKPRRVKFEQLIKVKNRKTTYCKLYPISKKEILVKIEIIEKKICRLCEIELPLSDFMKNEKNFDGVVEYCNACANKKKKHLYATDERYRNVTKERAKRYNGKSLERGKKYAAEISDTYVIASLKRGTSLKTEDLKKQKELIELKRVLIKIERFNRLMKNEQKN